MLVFQAAHNILMHPFHFLGVSGVFVGSLGQEAQRLCRQPFQPNYPESWRCHLAPTDAKASCTFWHFREFSSHLGICVPRAQGLQRALSLKLFTQKTFCRHHQDHTRQQLAFGLPFGLSVTRVGSAAQTSSMKQVGGAFKIDMA